MRLALGSAVPVCDTPGFEGLLSGTTISDLVQISCLTLAMRAIHVEGEGGRGSIYVAGGQVSHAETAAARGEEALFEILAWNHGRFGIEEGRTPPEVTITRMWQSVLLEAAYRFDESRRGAEGSAGEEGTVEASRSGPLDAAGIRAWVRFSRGGERRGGRGGDVEEMHSVWAYVLELSQALGKSLGLETLGSIEIRGPHGRAFCQVKADDVLALVGEPGVDVMNAAAEASGS